MERVNQDGLTEKQFLEQYRPGDYERPSVTVDMLIFSVNEARDTLKVLLVKRKDHPYIDCWAIPGGFMNMDESAGEAARRELAEETGLTDVYMEQLYTFTNPGRDPRMRIVSIAYMALISETDVTAGDDALDAAWFDIMQAEDKVYLHNEERGIIMKYTVKDNVFQNGVLTIDDYYLETEGFPKFAFDHQNLFYTGLVRLRGKAEYTPLLFNLMPEQFTLAELQKVYELVLNRKLYKMSLKRMAEPYIEMTGKKMERRGKSSGKPPMFYRYVGKKDAGMEGLL